MTPRLFVFGLGYVGQAFAAYFQARWGGVVSGTTRRAEKANSLSQKGWVIVPSLDDSQVFPLLLTATHILWTIPPLEDDWDPASIVSTVPLQNLKWLGYISSTSVYGDHQGGSVDETTTPCPNTPEGEKRLKTEKDFLQLSPKLPVHIFRCAGIYGPGRNVLHNILQGKAQRIHHPGVVFSRIHLQDILGILEASICHVEPGQIYNMADDYPASTADMVEYGCQLLNKPSLPLLSLEEAKLSDMGRAFYKSSKCVSNHKIKNQLGVKLFFPSYQKGLEVLLKTDRLNA